MLKVIGSVLTNGIARIKWSYRLVAKYSQFTMLGAVLNGNKAQKKAKKNIISVIINNIT
jgi:hypothetical protein